MNNWICESVASALKYNLGLESYVFFYDWTRLGSNFITSSSSAAAAGASREILYNFISPSYVVAQHKWKKKLANRN